MNGVNGADTGALTIQRVNSMQISAGAGGFGSGTMVLDPSLVSSLYQDGLSEVRVNALFGLSLIRVYQ